MPICLDWLYSDFIGLLKENSNTTMTFKMKRVDIQVIYWSEKVVFL